MALRNSESENLSPWRQHGLLSSAVVAGGLIVGVGALAAGVLLWAHYGTAVFFEMIASGIAACF